MATLKATRTAQYPLVAMFTFNFDDTMLDKDGVSQDFNAVATSIFDVINLPVGSKVIGGTVNVLTAWATAATSTVKVGDSGDDDRYSNSSTVDLKTTGRTALTPTTFVNSDGLNVRITVANATSASTAGKATIEVEYVIEDRANEVQPA